MTDSPLSPRSVPRRGRLLRRAAVLGGLLATALAARAADLVGLAYPLYDVQVSAAVPGLVQRIHVRPGQRVQPGEVLVELDGTAQQAELRRRAVLMDDDSELQGARQRLRTLAELLQMTETVAARSQSVSREELLKARLEKVAAEARVQQLEAQKARERVEHEQARIDLSQRAIRAPIAAVVVDVPVDPGEWAKPGDVVVRMADISQVELRLNLPQAVATGFKAGRPVTAEFEAGTARVQATGAVRFVSPLADSASGLVDVRVRFPNPRGQIRPGAKAVIRGAGNPS